MPVLLIDHSGKRIRTAIAGRASIGRTVDNDVVIQHPAVSRRHALIEQAGEVFYIEDNGSKNGVLIGTELLAGKKELRDGDRIRIGPAVVTFKTDDSYIDQPGQSILSETHDGILLDCTCGAKLWVPKQLIGGRGQCQKCGQNVALDAPPPRLAQTCSICQWKIDAGMSKQTCPACGLVFHQDCWIENKGCSAYGCSHVSILEEPTDSPSGALEENGIPQVIALPAAKFPWEFALLAVSVLASLLGLLAFGTLSLVIFSFTAILWMKKRNESRTSILVLAMSVALIGTVAGAGVSCFWWLNWSPWQIMGSR